MRRMFASAALVALLTAGCGGGDSEGDAPNAAPTAAATTAAAETVPLDETAVTPDPKPTKLGEPVSLLVDGAEGQVVVTVTPTALEQIDDADITAGADPKQQFYAVRYTVEYVNGTPGFGGAQVTVGIRSEPGIAGIPGTISAGQVTAAGCEASQDVVKGVGDKVESCVISGMIDSTEAQGVTTRGADGEEIYWPAA